MSLPSSALPKDPVHRLIVKLVIAVVAVGFTAAIAVNVRPVDRQHAPLGETAIQWAPEATTTTTTTETTITTATAPEAGVRP